MPGKNPPWNELALKRLTILAWGAALLVWTAWLGRLDLLNPDEARHAAIAREMLATGEFLTPYIHGVPYYDKPVFLHWTLALTQAFFGKYSWALRLPIVLASLCTVFAAWRWSSRAFGRLAGACTVAVLATTPLFVGIGRFVVSDMLLAASLTGALSWLGIWLLEKKRSRRSILPFWALLGLGTLIKGPVALVLGGAVLLAMLVLERANTRLRDVAPIRGPLVAVAVAAPWYLTAWYADPAYIETFLWHHNVQRFAAEGEHAHQIGLLFFFWALPLALMPWTPTLVQKFLEIRERGANPATRYALVWAGCVVGFFTFSSTKIITYVLPAFAPLAALTGLAVADCLRGRIDPVGWVRFSWRLPRAVLGLLTVAVVEFALIEYREMIPGLWRLLPVVLVASVPRILDRAGWFDHEGADGSAAASSRRPGTARALPGNTAHPEIVVGLARAVSATLALTLLVYGPGADIVNLYSGQCAAAEALAATGTGTRLASYRTEPHAAAFYSGRSATRPDDPQFARRHLLSGGQTALLTKRKHLETLELSEIPENALVIWENRAGKVLLAGGRAAEAARKADLAADRPESRPPLPWCGGLR